MEDENFKIAKVIEESLADTGIDLLQDFTQLGIQEFLNNPVWGEMPFVKLVIGAIKGTLAIREIHFARNLFTFFKTFHQGGLSEEKRLNFLERIKSDKNYAQKVVENIAVLNDRFISKEKSIVLAKLLRSHVNGCFDYNEFRNLSELLDTIHVRAFEPLRRIALASPGGLEFAEINYAASPNHTDGPMLVGFGLAALNSNYYSINHTGIMFYLYGIEGDINSTPGKFKERG